MAKDYSSIPYAEMRRNDKATEDRWIREFIKRAAVGVLATAYENQPFINSNVFAYDEASHAIYMHSADVGRTRANVEANGRVCFHAFEMGRLLPADEALEFSVEYGSVTVFGVASIVEEDADKERGLQMLLDKYAPHLRSGRDYRPITPDELKRTAVYRIDIEQWSGKKGEEAEDFPGAFRYEEIIGPGD